MLNGVMTIVFQETLTTKGILITYFEYPFPNQIRFLFLKTWSLGGHTWSFVVIRATINDNE